jgi:hypothetical protein
MSETENEYPGNLRKRNSGNKREITVAAMVSAASLAWYIGSSWVNFRSDIYSNIYSININIATLTAQFASYDKSADEKFKQLIRVDEKLNVLFESIQAIKNDFEYRIIKMENNKK